MCSRGAFAPSHAHTRGHGTSWIRRVCPALHAPRKQPLRFGGRIAHFGEAGGVAHSPATACARPPRNREEGPADGSDGSEAVENDVEGASRDSSLSRSGIDKEILLLAVPALGGLALDPVLSLIDTAFIGRLGDAAALGGMGIASVVLSISFSVFNFLAIATTPLVARASGAEQSGSSGPTVSRVISVALYLSIFIGALSGSSLFFGASAVCRAMGASSAVLPYAVSYLRARVIVSPFVLASFVINGAFRGLRDTRTPFFVALVANATNLVLDPLLIFSLGLGVQGAALATSFSQIVAVTLMVKVMVRDGRLRRADMMRVPSFPEVSPLLKAGAALTVRTCSILGTVAYATATASKLGVESLAAFEIVRQLFTLHAMVLDSIAAAAQALVSSLIASGAFVRARRVANRALQLGAIFGSFIGLAALLFGTSVPGIFTQSRETSILTVSCIRMAALVTPLNGAVFALDGVLAAAKDFSYMAFAIAVAGVTAISVLTIIRTLGGGVVAVWGGLNCLMVMRAVVLFARYVSKRCPVPPIKMATQSEARV